MPTFNDLVLTNTFGHHKVSRRWTWPSPNGQHHSQIYYILVRKRFRSEVNIARTRSFPGADIESGNNSLMMTFHLCLKRISKPKHTRLKFDLEKLEDSKCVGNLPSHDRREVCTSHHHKQWRYWPGFNDHHLQNCSNWNSQWGTWQRSSEEKKTWVTAKILDLYDRRRELRKKRFEPEDLRNTGKWTTTSSTKTTL